MIATFDPHPVRHFRPDTPPFRLTSLGQREELFAAAGADAMLVFAFDGELAATSPDDFIERLLVEHLGIHGVVTGEDFTFGAKAAGTRESLQNSPKIAAMNVCSVAEHGGTISSSRIREALKAGKPDEAARLLTRPFAVRGTVQHGDKRGRTIGYPTANLDMGQYLRPAYGIYAVTGRDLGSGESWQGAANLGVRPQFEPAKELLEPYFFDFDGDLYGREIEVALHHFIRPEARFDSLEALQAQMARDCDEARRLLAAG